MNRLLSRGPRMHTGSGLCFGTHPRQERGASLVLVLVLLTITATASAFFFNSMVGNTRLSGANRDNTASLLLAESAMEMLRGNFMYRLDAVTIDEASGTTQPVPDGVLDNMDLDKVREKMNTADPFGTAAGAELAHLSYIYFANNGVGSGLTESIPSILQKVANGEAARAVTTAVPSDHQVLSASLKVDDLFSGTLKPFIYKTNTNGLLIASDAASWSGETASQKAVAWLELTQNPTPGAIDFWVQAVGRVGFSNSYLQRYVGTFYEPAEGPGTVGGLSVLIEASNIDRRVSP